MRDPHNTILTPNQAEFERMWKCFMDGLEDNPISRKDRIESMDSFIKE